MTNKLTGGWFAACLLAAPTVARAQTSNRSMDWMSSPSWGWGHMLFGSFMMIVFWGAHIVVTILLVKWLLRGSHDSRHATPTAQTALEVLNMRYARGEIDKQEFEECRKDLTDQKPGQYRSCVSAAWRRYTGWSSGVFRWVVGATRNEAQNWTLGLMDNKWRCEHACG